MSNILKYQKKSTNRSITEAELFKQIAEQSGNLSVHENFEADINLIRNLLGFLVDAKQTPIIKADKISWLTGRSVYLKSEDHLLPGGSAKGRAVFGIILQNLRQYLDANPKDREELSTYQNPLSELLKRTFDGSAIIANSAGNHGISVAAVFNQLRKDYGIETNVIVYVPDNSPTFKQQRILAEGAEVVHYDSKADREQLLREHVAKFESENKRAFSYSTEPNKNINGGFKGLGSEAAEISEWLGKVTNSLSPLEQWEVRSPTSSGPTFGSILKYFEGKLKVVAVQDKRNGYFAVELLQLAERGEIEITEQQKAVLEALRSRISSTGSPENGLSTKKINGLTKEHLVDERGLKFDPKNIKLVSESVMKLTAALIFIETRDKKDIGAILPEKAGASATSSIVQEAILQPDFAKKLGEIIYWSNLGYNKFIELSGLNKNELESLGLGDLEKHVQFTPKSLFRRHTLSGGEKPVIAVVSGANRDQPLELELRKYLSGLKDLDSAFELLQAFVEAAPKTIHEIISRTKERVIRDKDGNEFVYHSGDVLRDAVEQAIGVQRDASSLTGKASAKAGIFNEKHHELATAESINGIKSLQQQVNYFRQDFLRAGVMIS